MVGIEKLDSIGGLWTIEAAARQLGMSVSQVRYAMLKHRLDAKAVGKTLLVNVNDLRAAVEREANG